MELIRSSSVHQGLIEIRQRKPLFQIELNGFQTFFNVLMNHVGKWDKDIIDELW